MQALTIGDASAMTVSIDFEKSDGLTGTFDIEGVFDSTMEEEAGIIGTIQKDGNVITMKDQTVKLWQKAEWSWSSNGPWY